MKNENKKKKDEKSRKNIKRIIAGILSLSMIISLIPNIKYYIKKNSIKNVRFRDKVSE